VSEVDNRAVPGTFEREADGQAFVRTDEPTAPAQASLGAPELELEELQAIADAAEASGFPPPAQVVAGIEAAKARAADAAAEARRLTRAPAKPPIETKTVAPPTETKE
jgi:hypothetical protein